MASRSWCCGPRSSAQAICGPAVSREPRHVLCATAGQYLELADLHGCVGGELGRADGCQRAFRRLPVPQQRGHVHLPASGERRLVAERGRQAPQPASSAGWRRTRSTPAPGSSAVHRLLHLAGARQRIGAGLSGAISAVGSFASSMASGALRAGQQFLSNLVTVARIHTGTHGVHRLADRAWHYQRHHGQHRQSWQRHSRRRESMPSPA